MGFFDKLRDGRQDKVFEEKLLYLRNPRVMEENFLYEQKRGKECCNNQVLESLVCK